MSFLSKLFLMLFIAVGAWLYFDLSKKPKPRRKIKKVTIEQPKPIEQSKPAQPDKNFPEYQKLRKAVALAESAVEKQEDRIELARLKIKTSAEKRAQNLWLKQAANGTSSTDEKTAFIALVMTRADKNFEGSTRFKQEQKRLEDLRVELSFCRQRLEEGPVNVELENKKLAQAEKEALEKFNEQSRKLYSAVEKVRDEARKKAYKEMSWPGNKDLSYTKRIATILERKNEAVEKYKKTAEYKQGMKKSENLKFLHAFHKRKHELGFGNELTEEEFRLSVQRQKELQPITSKKLFIKAGL